MEAALTNGLLPFQSILWPAPWGIRTDGGTLLPSPQAEGYLQPLSRRRQVGHLPDLRLLMLCKPEIGC
jgi:hypothetical protein